MAKQKTIKTDEAINTSEAVNETSDIKSEEAKPEQVKPGRTLTKEEIMKDNLSKQPKVSIIIPLEKGESKNAVETVILNGYRLNIKKGVYVEVPKQVADIIKDSYQQTEQAIQDAQKVLSESDRPVFNNSN